MTFKIWHVALIFVGGIAVGVIFYPSSRIEKRISEQHDMMLRDAVSEHRKELTHMTIKADTLTEEKQKLESEYKEKMASLRQEVTQLQRSKSIKRSRITRPDGTVEDYATVEDIINQSVQISEHMQREYDMKLASQMQTVTQQHQEQVESMQLEFARKEETYQRQIRELESSEVKETNMKRFGIEAGALINGNFYLHASADVVGPVFVGAHAQAGNNSTMGAGVGLRF